MRKDGVTAAPWSTESASDRARLLAVAWAVAVPVVAFVALVVGLVVPAVVDDPLRSSLRFLPSVEGATGTPRPTQQLQYLVALLTPALVGVAAVVLKLHLSSLRERSARMAKVVQLAVGAQLALALVVGVSWAAQDTIYEYFKPWQLALAGLGAMLAPLVLSAPAVRWSWLSRRWIGWIAIGVAVVVTLMAASVAIQTGSNIARAHPYTFHHLIYVQDELSSVAAGRTPLVDFTPQYSSLMPYLLAPAISAVSWEIGWLTILTAGLSAVALLAVFVGLRQLTGSAVRALPLYLLVLWFGLYTLGEGSGGAVFSVATYTAQMPIRELGPLVTFAVLVWCVARPTRMRVGVLGVVGGLAAFNSFDWGVPTLVAALVALVCGIAHRDRDALRATVVPLVTAFAAGALAALVGFVVLTSAVSGSLPDLSELWLFSRIFGREGFGAMPLSGLFGFHLIILVTFLACAALGFIRALGRAGAPDRDDRLRTAALTYAGIIGVGTASYYVNRPLSEVLVALFLGWALAVVLLAREAVSYLRDPATPVLGRQLTLLPAALLIGHVALMATMFHDSYAIFKQPRRILTGGSPRIFDQMTARRLALECTTPREPTMFIHPLGHVISGRTGRNNLFPYNHPNNVVTELQLDRVRQVLNDRRVNTVIAGAVWNDIDQMLVREGFRPFTTQPSNIPSGYFSNLGRDTVRVLTRNGHAPPSSCPRA